MEKRMNKKELIELISSLKIDLDECWMLSTASLVLRNMYPDAEDLDLAVTEKGLEQLKKNYNLIAKDNGFYIVNEKVECVLDTKEPWKVERLNNYNLLSLESYFEFLKNSKREKDKPKYGIVKKELEKRAKMEYLDLYDENGNPMNEKLLRSKDMTPIHNRYINIVIVFIENSEGKFLIQKTSKEKGSVFATTGGLVKSGFSCDDTINQEIKEELGLSNINPKKVYTETRKNAFQTIYYIKKDINIDDIILQKEEVEYVKWMSVYEIKTLIKNGEFREGNINAFNHIIENKRGDKKNKYFVKKNM